MKTLITILIISISVFYLASSVGIQIKDANILDLDGRQIRFHGPNVVVKVPPYIPIRDRYDKDLSFSKEDMENMTKLGFNGIRLGMMWAGVQPQPNKYNETYLDEMQALINEAGSYGIYTLIDFHQDLIAEQFCGDGIPTWLMDELKLYRTFPFPLGKKIKLNQSRLPNWEDCDTDNWGLYYFSRDVSHTFQELYTVGSKLNRKFTDYWRKVATKFKDNPYVIAYQLINEPFAGNPYRNPAILIPSMGQRYNFQHFYDSLAQQIREIDTKTPICFEPITFDQKIPTGFNHPPGGNRFKDLSIFCYHYYKPPALGYGTLDARVKDGKKLGVPSMMDQFGTADQYVMDFAEQNQQSWMFWGFKSFGKNWGERKPFYKSQGYDNVGNVQSRIRTYLQRIDGELINESFDSKSSSYIASYLAKPGGKSILFYSAEKHYPAGVIINANPNKEISYKQIQEGYIEISYNGQSSKPIQITIDRK